MPNLSKTGHPSDGTNGRVKVFKRDFGRFVYSLASLAKIFCLFLRQPPDKIVSCEHCGSLGYCLCIYYHGLEENLWHSNCASSVVLHLRDKRFVLAYPRRINLPLLKTKSCCTNLWSRRNNMKSFDFHIWFPDTDIGCISIDWHIMTYLRWTSYKRKFDPT